jgi:hypothetical protein
MATWLIPSRSLFREECRAYRYIIKMDKGSYMLGKCEDSEEAKMRAVWSLEVNHPYASRQCYGASGQLQQQILIRPYVRDEDHKYVL